MRKVICSIVCALLLVSCGEYNKILKSTDYELKYDYAKKAFERKKYMQAATLLEELVAIFKGTDRAEESFYWLGAIILIRIILRLANIFRRIINIIPKGNIPNWPVFIADMVIIWTLPRLNWIKQALIEQSMKCSVSSIISRIANGLNRHKILFLSYKTNLCIKSY